ncbi:MAG: Ig-like domain-containing protein [Anaerolineae bacterium]
MSIKRPQSHIRRATLKRPERAARLRRALTIFLTSLALAAIACNLPWFGGKETPQPEAEGQAVPTPDLSQLPSTAPKIVLQRPLSGEELPLDGSIDIYFDQPMNALSVEDALRIEPAVEYTLTWIDDSTLRVTPRAGALQRATSYKVIIGAAATSRAGLAAEGEATLEVQTVGFLEVGEVVPAPDAQGVDTSSVITVFFNRPVVPLTVGGAGADQPQPLTIDPPVAGSGEWINTSIYMFRPDTALAGGRTYTVSVPAGLTDQTGGVLQETYTWQFSTDLPNVVSFSPYDQATLVELDAPVTVEFNQPMDRPSTEAAFSLTVSGTGERVSGTFTWDDDSRAMTFTPTQPLPLGTRFEAVMAASALGASREAGLVQAARWTFETVPYPAVLRTSPPDGAQGVPVWNGISITFSAPVDERTLQDKLQIDPAPPDDIFFYYNSWDQTWNASLSLEPATTYTVTLLPGAADRYGNRITEPYTFSFTTGDLDPLVFLNTPGPYGLYSAARPTELFIQHRNVDRVSFSLSSLTPQEFASLIDTWSFSDYQQPAERVIREWSLDVAGELNETTFARVAVTEDGSSLPPGIYLLIVDAPEIEGDLRHIMVVSSANLTLKAGLSESLGWLTDLESGQPISGAAVTFYDAGFNRLAQGTTDADGVVRVPVQQQGSLWRVQYALWQEGGSFALALSTWSTGIEPWDFGYFGQFEPTRFTTYLYTDRPIYRPGQEVYFKGILRAKDDVTYTIPPNTTISVEVMNDRGETIYSEDLPLNDLGTFEGTITLSEDAGLGYYAIQVRLGDQYFARGFQVAEYRVPEFVVNVTPDSDQVAAGDKLTAQVAASFYFGGAVSDADLSWTLLTDRYFFTYTGPGRYSFGDYEYDEQFLAENYVPGYGTVIDEGTGVTDADGRFVINVPTRLEEVNQSRRLTIEATVTDVEGRPVSGRAEVIVHSADLYVGVSPQTYVGAAGEQIGADLITVGWDSTPLPNREVTVQLVRREWSSVLEEDEFGRTQYVWSYEDIPVSDPVSVTTDANGRATVSFVPPEGGVYRIEAVVRDERGRESKSSAYLWVTDAEYVAWRQTNDNRIDMVADRRSYRPGDTAEVLITSPWAGDNVRALITIERGGILSHTVVQLTTNSYVYRIPITGALAPNVYVSAVLIRGGDEADPLPDFKAGLVELVVEPVEQTINLTITPDKQVTGPRDTVTFTVQAADFAGNPVDAELSLALVDLATLSLAPPNSEPIVDHFYGVQGIGVRTAVPLSLLVDRLTQTLIDQGKGGGGGGGEGFFEVRTEFEDTAAWQARLRTGPTGSTTFTITLPDNLTTWRLDVRAVTASTLVGQATYDIVATKPLLVRPVTPRFFVADDQATLSTMINNNTADDLSVTVTLQGTGVRILNDETQVVEVPANGRVEVAWPVSVRPDTDWVDLTFTAVADNGLSDASKPPLGDPAHERMLPVYRYEVPEVAGTAGQLVEAGERLEGIVLPPTYEVTAGGISVRLDPSLASATLDALTYLRNYPYDCTEQTISRFLPNALTLRAFQTFGLEDRELRANLDEQIRIGLQKLYAQQHVDGGWGWFVSGPSDSLVTAYAVQGLLAARDAGVQVDEAVLDNALTYLRAQVGNLPQFATQAELHRQTYLAYVLAEAGQADPAVLNQLYEQRTNMQHFAWALLAQAISRVSTADPRLDTLESGLINNAILSATGVHWEEDRDDSFNWNTDTRSTAIILSTFARLWPTSDLAPNIVRWLMIARQGEHWSTTQETAWALIGLTDWMVASGELQAGYTWDVTFNGVPTASGTASADTLDEAATVEIPFEQIATSGVNRLAIARGAGPGRLYYTAHLTAYLPVEQIDPLSRGLIVSRRYLNAEGQPITEARLGEVVTVELTIITPHDRYYVVVEDPYPAGAEAIDVGLLTESVVGERPTLRPDDPLYDGWGWWWFSQTDLRDEKAVLYADYLPAGTYQYTYQVRMGVVGTYRVIPPTAQEFYLPEVYGRGEGMLFTIKPAQ